MRAIRFATLAIALTSAPIVAKTKDRPPMPAGFDDPGPQPEHVLQKVFAKLRTSLRDPYSIRDFKLCEPKVIDAYYGLDWVRAHWNVRVSLNSKNSYGGYTGPTEFHIQFENGEAASVSQFDGIGVLTPDQNAKLLALSQACPKITDAEIQRLLAE